jgi:hypothetical protein
LPAPLDIHVLVGLKPFIAEILQIGQNKEVEDCYDEFISNTLVNATKVGNIEDIKKLLPLVYESQKATEIIIKACEVATRISCPHAVHVLLQSGVFLDCTVEPILNMATMEHNPERFLLLLFTLLTYRGIDTAFVNTAMHGVKSLIQKYGSEHKLQTRLDNMIQYSRTMQHSLFSPPQNRTIDVDDAEKILGQAAWLR